MPPSDTAVVIGGRGFIGRHLVPLLLEAGCRVTVVSRRAAPGTGDAPGLAYRSGDVADAGAMLRVIEGAGVVYDLSLAGGPTWEECRRVYVEGARHVARACLAHGVRRLIYTSSIAALYLGGRGVVDERTGPDPRVAGRNSYARAKAEAENLLLEMHAREGLPVVVMRPGAVVGRGGALVHGAVGQATADTCLLGWGRGRTPLPFVLANDVARAMLAAKDAPAIDGRAFNLVGDVRPSAAEYVRLVAERSLRNFRFYGRSLPLIAAVDGVKWAAKALLRKPGNQRICYRDLETLAMPAPFDCSAAKRLLGWTPVADPETFLRETIDVHLPPVHPGDPRLAPRPLR